MLLVLIMATLVLAAIALGWGTTSAFALHTAVDHSLSQIAAYDIHAGERTLLNSFRQQIAAGDATLTLPAPDQQTLCTAPQSGGSCEYIGTIRYAFSGGSSPVTGASTTGPSGGQMQTADNMQTLLNEGEVAVDIVSTASASGTTVAIRSEQVTIRLETAAPFADIASRMDLAQVANGSAQAAAGDYSGCDPANAATCDSQVSVAPGDTRLAPNPTCTADPLTGACAINTPPPATYGTTQFTNGNDSTGGWSR